MAAYNFPNSPSDGDTVTSNGITYTYSSSKTRWDGAAPSGSSTTVYATIDLLPLSGASTGDQAYVSGNNRLYIWNGTGWYNIALINTTPSISGASASYALAIDGTATTVTITATDPEGIPITYSIASDTSGNVATVTQGTGANANVFTITPSTNAANEGTFSLTFRASDGVNIATAVSSFTLTFSVENSNYTTALITSVGANNAVNNSFDDASTNNHTITANGNVTQNTFSPYRHGGYSTLFDGTGDYLQLGHTAALRMGASDFCVEAWIYIDTHKNYNYIFSYGRPLQLAVSSAGQFLFFCSTASGSATHTCHGTSTLETKKWHHVAASRDGNTLQCYVDGVRENTTDVTGVTFLESEISNTFPRVADWSGGNNAFNGYLRDVRAVKGSAVRTGTSFTLPDKPLSAITNTSLLTCHLPYIGGDIAPTGYTGSGAIVGFSGNLTAGTLANAFDGSLSTSVSIRSSGSFIEFTFPQQQTGELQVNLTNGNDSGDDNVRFWIDGVEGTAFDVSSQSWYSLTSSSDNFTTVKLEHTGSTTADIYGFRIGTSGDTIIGLKPDITVVGNTTTEPFAPYDNSPYVASNNGGSIYFDGSGDYLVTGADADQFINSGNTGTIEMWLYLDAFTNPRTSLCGQWTSTGGYAGWTLDLDTSGQLVIGVNGNINSAKTTGLTLGRWHHFAVVNTGSAINIFTDGIYKSTSTNASATSASSSSLVVGARSDDSLPVNGVIADFRFVDGTAVYDVGSASVGDIVFTPPTVPLTAITNTSLLLRGTNAGIIDKSQSVKTITLNGDAKSSTTQSKYLTSSMYFDGTGDSLTIGNNQGLHIGSGDFTIEMWLRAAAVDTSANQTLMLRRSVVGARGLVININTSSKLGFVAGDSSTGAWEISFNSTSDLSANTWHHIAIVRSGNNFYLYLDGTREATASSSATIADDTSDLIIGTNEAGTGDFSGYISDLRITKGLARYTASDETANIPSGALQG